MRGAPFLFTFLRLALLAYSQGVNVFDTSVVDVTVPRQPGSHYALAFQSPILSAEDGETFRLSILQSEYSNAFSVSTRQIRAGEQFDVLVDNADVLRNVDHIRLSIEAQSETTSSRGEFELNIEVVSDAPGRVFSADEYTFQVPSAFKTALVGTLKLAVGTSMDGLRFTLFGSMAKYFLLEPKTSGEVDLLSQECRWECSKIPSKFVLVARAELENEPSKGYDTQIVISLADGHGVAPKFTRSVVPLTLREQSAIENPLILEASDTDSDRLVFSLKDHNDVFDVDSESGVLTVTDAQQLTIENLGERFNLTLTVSDGSNDVDTAVVIVSIEPKTSLESSTPKFTQEVYAFAASPGSTFVGTVSVGGVDRDVTYRISEGGASLFNLNATDGRITYSGPLEKNARNYTLKVLALDGSSPPQMDIASVQVLIAGLGSSPAKFTDSVPVIITANKDMSAGELLHRFRARDDDPDAKLVFAVESVLALDENGNEVKDSSEFLNYLRVDADGSLFLANALRNTSLMAIHARLTVTDANHHAEPQDNADIVIRLVLPEERIADSELLKFERIPKVVTVPEDIPIGSYVYTVNVRPIPSHLSRNGRVTYSLSERHRMFAVNPVTGIMTTVTSLRGSGDSNVTVIANQPDSQTSAAVSLVVRVTPSSSRSMLKLNADSFVFNVTENSPVGTLISSPIGPSLQSNVSYRIFGGDSAFFDVDDQGSIRTALDVDREVHSRLSTFVYAFHSKDQVSIIPITVNVIDENDVEPQFPSKSYAATVMENSPISTFIVKAQAVDADDDVLDYSLMMNSDSAGLSSLLTVDRQGVIRNAEPLLGLEGKYQFAVIARDGKHSGASATVFLTILPTSKCQPVFPESTPTVFYIKENEEPPQLLARFVGEVPSEDCALTYAIWNGNAYVNETELFVIDTHTGELSSHKAFDFEQNNRYSLVVATQSGELFAQLDVEIRVVDTNDNAVDVVDRTSHFNVAEDEQAGKVIGRIRARDKDVSDQVYFHLSNELDKFNVGLTDGILSLKEQLDRESQDSYELKVLVTNSEQAPPPDVEPSGDSAMAVVHITVLDVNDNGPIFEKELYVAAVPRSALAGTKLLTVHASDPDLTNQLSPSGEVVVYGIDDTIYRYLDRTRQANGFVAIDDRTGELSLGQSPDEFTGGVFESRIVSSDVSNTQTHVAAAKLKLWIYDDINKVEMKMDENAKNLKASHIEEVIGMLSGLCECDVVLLGVNYDSSEGRILRQSVSAHFLFINRTDDSIMTSEHAIAIVDKKALDPKTVVPKLNAVQEMNKSHRPSSETSVRTGEAAMLLGIFALLLISVLIIFSLILCYHRSRFLREKRIYEDEKIAVGTLNKNNRYKQPPPYVSPPVYNLKEKCPMVDNRSGYGTQEVNMIVEDDGPQKRVRYTARQSAL